MTEQTILVNELNRASEQEIQLMLATLEMLKQGQERQSDGLDKQADKLDVLIGTVNDIKITIEKHGFVLEATEQITRNTCARLDEIESVYVPTRCAQFHDQLDELVSESRIDSGVSATKKASCELFHKQMNDLMDEEKLGAGSRNTKKAFHGTLFKLMQLALPIAAVLLTYILSTNNRISTTPPADYSKYNSVLLMQLLDQKTKTSAPTSEIPANMPDPVMK